MERWLGSAGYSTRFQSDLRAALANAEDQKQQAKDDLDTEMAKPMPERVVRSCGIGICRTLSPKPRLCASPRTIRKDAVIAKLKTQKEELEGQLKEVGDRHVDV